MTILSDIKVTETAIEKEIKALADAEQNVVSRNEALRLLKDKADRQAQTLAETKARISRQILDLNHEALVDVLVKQGVTCLGEDLVTAADIIKDAADIFERSFWTTGAEIRQEIVAETEADLLACIPNDLKHFVAEVPGVGWAAVTGVCSVGAIGLVRSMKAESKEIKTTFNDLFLIDWPTRLATEAVARALRAEVVEIHGIQCFLNTTANDAIIKANDQHLNKEQVIAGFRAAESDPILKADEIWTIDVDGYSQSGVVRGSKAEIVDLISAIRAGDENQSLEAAWAVYYWGTTRKMAPKRLTSKAEYAARRAERVLDL